MKLDKKTLVTALTSLLIGIIVTSIIWVYASPSAGTFYISEGIYPSAPNYTIWGEGSTYYAKNAYGHIDYSGTNATQLIQNALNHGKTIFIKDGIYPISGSAPSGGLLTITQNGTKIIGESWNTILNDTSGIGINLILGTNKQDVLIENLQLIGNNVSNAGVWFFDSRRITIRHNYVNNMLAGIVVHDSRDVDATFPSNNVDITVTENLVTNSFVDHIYVSTVNGVVSNNICDNSAKDSGIVISIMSHNVVVSGNVIKDCYAFGIAIAMSFNVAVSGNTIIGGGGSQNHGICICTDDNASRASRGISIVGNLIESVGLYGIYTQQYVEDVTISSNTIRSANRGIQIYQNCKNITISSNTITTIGDQGIFLQSSNLLVSANSVSTAQNNGIFVYEGGGNIITSNIVRYNNGYGVHLNSTGENILALNDLRDNGSGAYTGNVGSDIIDNNNES